MAVLRAPLEEHEKRRTSTPWVPKLSPAPATLGRYLTAPTQPWDALICTSTAVRGAVERILDHHADYLERRLSRSTGSGSIHSPVRLPVIPLGVDCDRFESGSAGSGSGSRRELRARLRIAEEDVAVLFVGRLSFHAKAHPTPMFLAARRAARRVPGRRVHLLLAGQFSNNRIEAEFRAAATRFCGGARAHFLDGSDGPHGPAMQAAWRAADLFVSLSDNVQETFGLTPVEAMAAGLPCVVSDWNGYRDTVVEGETGFRIPTVAAPPGAGIDVADRHAAGLDTYDKMIGITSLATAVDVEACAEAVAALARDRELRACMGATGRARARRLYDWRVVVAAYQELWAELAEVRRAGEGVALRNPPTESARIDYPDPFGIYRDHATDLLTGSDTVVVAGSGRAARDLARLREGWLHRFAEGAFLPDADVDALMARLATGRYGSPIWSPMPRPARASCCARCCGSGSSIWWSSIPRGRGASSSSVPGAARSRRRQINDSSEAPCNSPEAPCNSPEAPCSSPEASCSSPEAPCNSPEVPCSSSEAPCKRTAPPCCPG